MTGQQIIAWHGDPDLKARIVERMRTHREADDFIQMVYQLVDRSSPFGYRGCAVGCALDKQADAGDLEGRRRLDQFETIGGADVLGWHAEMERQFGIPYQLAEIIDAVFEELADPQHGEFAVRILEEIPVGADLSRVADAYYADAQEDDLAELLCRLVAEAPIAEAATS